MKTRRHHNNDGRTQIRRGRTREQVERIADKLRCSCGKFHSGICCTAAEAMDELHPGIFDTP